MVGLSEEDIERIRSFANKPRYRRDPSNLMPEGDHDEGDEDDADRAALENAADPRSYDERGK